MAASCRDSHSGCTIGRRRSSAKSASTAFAAHSRSKAAVGVSSPAVWSVCITAHPRKRRAVTICMRGGSPETLIVRHAPQAPRYAGFRVVDVSVQDLPDPVGRLRAIPLIAELKDLDPRPHPHGAAMHHAAQRIKSGHFIAIWPSPRKPGSEW
jgi:hypothetical protein